MFQSIASSLLHEISQIEKNIQNINGSSDIIFRFNPLLWLESSDQLYLSNITGICLINPDETFTLCLQELYQRLLKFDNHEKSTPHDAIFILTLSEIIRHLPIDKIKTDLSNLFAKIVNINYHLFSSQYSMILPSIKNSLEVGILAGINPIKEIFSLFGDLIDPSITLEKCSYILCSASTFRSFMEFSPRLFSLVMPEQKIHFYENYYFTISKFFMKYPRAHAQLVMTGVSEAENLFTELNKTRNPEPELIAILCAIVPLCHNQLNESINAKKDGNLSHLFKLILDYKSKRMNMRYYCSIGFLELSEALLLAGQAAQDKFVSIKNFVESNSEKFIKFFFSKNSDQLTDKLQSDFLPRYAAVDLAQTKEISTSKVVRALIKQSHQINGWKCIIIFMNFVFKNYPTAGNFSLIPSQHFRGVYKKLNEMITIIKSKQGDVENAAQLIHLILQFISYSSNKFSLYSSLEFNDQITENIQFPHQFITFIKRNKEMKEQIIMMKNLLSFISSSSDSKIIGPVVSFLRIFYTFNETTLSVENNQQAIEFINELVLGFHDEIKISMLINSPNCYVFPYLFHHMLHWALQVLKFTFDKNTGKIETKFVQEIATTSLLIRSITNSQSICNKYEKLIIQILNLYNIEYPYVYPKIQIDQLVTNATSYVFMVWLNYIINKVSCEKNCSCNITPIQRMELLGTAHRETICALTSFLCMFAHAIPDGPSPNGQIKNQKQHFFNVSYTYINFLNEPDPMFAQAFIGLKNDTFPCFKEVTELFLFQRAIEYQFDHPFFWVNAIGIFTYLASRKGNGKDEIEFFESAIPIFFSILEFGAFEKQNAIFVKNISSYVISLYSSENIKNMTVDVTRQRLTFISMLEICIRYLNCEQPNEDILDDFIQAYPYILTNCKLDSASSNPHLDYLSSEHRFLKDIIFILSCFEMFVQKLTTNESIISNIQQSLNEIIQNNNYAWTAYSFFASKSKILFKSMLVTSLTLVCGVDIQNIYKETELSNKTTFKHKQASPAKNDKSGVGSRFSVPHSPNDLRNLVDKLTVKNLLLKLKIPKENAFSTHEVTQPYNLLIQNKFNLFKNPPSLNLHFIESCISCVAAYNYHEMLFEEMVKQATPEIFDTENPVSAFFTAWLLYGTRRWQLTSLINAISLENPQEFIDKFEPPHFFAYYISKYAKMTSNKNSIEMFIKSFITPLITCPIRYEVKKYIKKADAEKFITILTKSQQFETLMITLCNSEMIYPVIENYSFCSDREFVLSFVGERPKAIDRKFGMSVEEPLSAQDALVLSVANWITDAGQIGETAAILIKLSDIQHASPLSIANDFFDHLNNYPTKKITLLIDVSAMSEQDTLFEAFSEIVRQIKNENRIYIDRIAKLLILNPSMDTTPILNDKLSNIVSFDQIIKLKLLEVVDNIENIFTENDKVFLPQSAFGFSHEKRAKINLTYNGNPATFIICDDYFILSSIQTLFNQKVPHSICFRIQSIVSLEDVHDSEGQGISIVYHTARSGQKTYRLSTPRGRYIVYAYNLLKERCEVNTTMKDNIPERMPIFTPYDIISNISPFPNVQLISFAILQLSSPLQRSLEFQSLQLLEAALHFGNNNSNLCALQNCSIYLSNEFQVNFSMIFHDIEYAGLIEEVSVSLSKYINLNTPSSTIRNLLPLFARYMNVSKNIVAMSEVLLNIYRTSKKHGNAALLERFFFNQIESELAIEISIPLIIRTSTGIKGKSISVIRQGDEEIDSAIAQRCFQSMMINHPKLVGKIICDKIFDGTIRRRSFGNIIPAAKIFATIPSLPFNSKEFLSIDLALFFFCTIMEGTHAPLDIVGYIKQCYEGILNTLCQFHENNEPVILKIKQQIMNLLEHPRVLNPMDLILLIDRLMEVIGDSYHQRFRQLLTETRPDDNPRVWYVKSVAEVYFTGGNVETGMRFIKMMPQLFRALDFGAQKLAVCFDSISMVQKTFQSSDPHPLLLFWAPLIASNHPNSMLRKASLQLLKTTLEFAQQNGNFKNLSGLNTTRYISDAIETPVSLFEKALNINFKESFCLSLISVLIRGIEEIDTRKSAIDAIKFCITAFSDDVMNAILFALPLLAFAPDDDTNWVVETLDLENCKTIQDVIFYHFDQRDESETRWIVNFINRFFGERTCQHKIDALSDTLLYGAKKYSSLFNEIKAWVIAKCIKMIDIESTKKTYKKLSNIAAAYLKLDGSKSVNTTEINVKFEKITNKDINALITGIVDGTALIIKMNL
ncbi:hypothetical protein TRFO_33521 [Tritrichomonas foetus]|uniref:Uncharacterized protein n=1 Tax=Tritrichomonas foetus TaxID=1144522 RepID=A0A1J4JLJ2_9EUKA|nr:hypothetical protein TRFO_33521 [Tritrichomonas foetus]|eukprot:OHS99954.1 hypothetical protein TRFO_33521 [Tritrichomonas foetus]